VTDRDTFCRELRERLLAASEKVVLRIAIAPHFERPLELTGGELLERAESLATTLAPPKDRSVVLILLPHSPELFLLQVGLILKGHIPAVLAWPTNRVDPEKYQRNLVHQLSQLPADLLLTLPRLARNLAASLPYPARQVPIANTAALDKLFPAGAVGEQLAHRAFSPQMMVSPPDALFLQFSGGTSGAQKAIVVTPSMLYEQLCQLGAALQFTANDSIVSWLPLYHDMGLIAGYWMPLWYGAASTQIAANDWVINPELLLKYISRYRATFCWLPNFSFSYLAQRRAFMQQTHHLESVRAWINCSEPVRLKSIDEFTEAFANWGVRKESVQSSYAMAETVFAITQSPLGERLRTIARDGLQHGNSSYSHRAFDLLDPEYVSSGRLLSNTSVQILAPDGSACPEAVAGEIYVHGPSLFSGYWGTDGFQTHSLQNGWHATGDYGFLANAELFVIGRLKDIVIVGGNNIFPEDVEAVVNALPGVYPGRVVAFGVDDKAYGTQCLAIVAETKDGFSDEAASGLEADIRKLVLTAIGIAARHVAVVPSRWIVKSTAGKISRRETRDRFLREKMAVIT
jgi:fatty-acyl-CoA synthase